MPAHGPVPKPPRSRTASRPPARRPRRVVVAASDCERCRDGAITQPVNTVSSLGFVVAGALVLAARRRKRARPPGTVPVGWAMVAAGLGSIAYHGPGTAFARWLHDATLLDLAGTIAVTDLLGSPIRAGRPGVGPSAVEGADGGPRTTTGRGTTSGALAMVAVASAALAHPRTTMPAQAVAAGLATVLEIRRFATPDPPAATDRRRGALAALLAAAGLALQVNGRTGRPWCRPDSLLQAHAGWHLLSAAALWARHA